MNKKNTGKLGLLALVVTMMGVSQAFSQEPDSEREASHGDIKCVGVYHVIKESGNGFFGGSKGSNKIVTVKSKKHESLLEACSDVLEQAPQSKDGGNGFFGGAKYQVANFVSMTCEDLSSHQTYNLNQICGL